MKKTAANRSPSFVQRQALAKRMHRDSHGVNFCERLNGLPSRVSNWPRIRIVEAREVLRVYAMLRGGDPCPLCKRAYVKCPWFELHHIASGAGRSDEYANLINLCSDCHVKIQHSKTHEAAVWLARESANPWSCASMGEIFSVALTWGVSKLTQPLPADHLHRLFGTIGEEQQAA